MADAVLTVYQGGTLTLANCFQDIGLAIPASNPMTADQTGRLPIFYVADGVYRVLLVDPVGVKIYDYPQVAAIGGSTSGGGGVAVDPTTVFGTGDLIWLDTDATRIGWVRDNGRTIGSATSGASERGNSDCQSLFLFGWAAGWTVVGGSGATAAADWAANKQITLPDKRGRLPMGSDTMGNTSSGLFGSVPVVSGAISVAGSVVGENTHVLQLTESAPHTHGTSASAGTDTPDHSHLGGSALNQNGTVGSFNAIGNTGNVWYGTSIGTLGAQQRHSHAITVALDSQGGGAAHNNVPLAVLGTFYRKL